ncbi:MAG: ABC transporter permease [Candidatus Nanopelagicales bacterium]|jgi:peptide/nickel transport system permease protein
MTNLTWTRRRRAAAATWRAFRRDRRGMIGLCILVIFTMAALLSYVVVEPTDLDPALAPGLPTQSPTVTPPLGTDQFGRALLDLLLVGTRVSLTVGIAATLGAVLLGAAMGILAGFYAGRPLGSVLTALTDWFLVIPWLVLAIVLAAILGPTLLNVIIVIAVTSWALTARLVRAQTLAIREQPYIERARALGASNARLLTRHILPEVAPVITAQGVLTVAVAILSETTLALLGLGDPNSMSWGRIIEEAFRAGAMSNGYWWWILPPGICVVLVTLAFSLVGYALEEILDPRLRGAR